MTAQSGDSGNLEPRREEGPENIPHHESPEPRDREQRLDANPAKGPPRREPSNQRKGVERYEAEQAHENDRNAHAERREPGEQSMPRPDAARGNLGAIGLRALGRISLRARSSTPSSGARSRAGHGRHGDRRRIGSATLRR